MGTVVKRDGRAIADLTEDDQEVVIAKGGDGGFGNAHFKSSTRQAPKIAELGEMGDAFEAELELKLLADVGLVGFPCAVKYWVRIAPKSLFAACRSRCSFQNSVFALSNILFPG